MKKKYSIIFIGFLTLLLSFHAKAGDVILSGKVDNYLNDYFVIGTPINNNFNRFDYKASDTIRVVEKKFYTKIKIEKSSFIYLNFFKNFIYLAVVPGDSIHIEFDIDNFDEYRYVPCTFSGSNMAGNNFFYRYDYFPGQKYENLWNMLAADVNVKDLTNGILNEINKQSKPFDSLYLKNKISKEYYKLVTKSIQLLLITEAVRRLNNESIKFKQLSAENQVEASEDLLARASENSEIIPQCLLSEYFLKIVVLFNQMKNYGGHNIYKVEKDTLVNYNNKSYFLPGYLASYYGIENEEYFLGSNILSFFSVSIPIDKLAGAKEYYTKKYPNSEYTNAIKKILTATNTNEKIAKKSLSASQENKFITEKFFLDSTGTHPDFTFTNFPEINKGIVYVDLWATWCGPCLAEMEFNAPVDSLMQTVGVKRLYISIDDLAVKKKVVETIQKKKIGGYHIFAGKEMRKYLDKEFGFNGGAISIPYYIILKDGNILYKNAYRPSEFKLLKKQIAKALEN